jgi:hypothetical protein
MKPKVLKKIEYLPSTLVRFMVSGHSALRLWNSALAFVSACWKLHYIKVLHKVHDFASS